MMSNKIMKTSEQFTSTALFLKKQSQFIITNNNPPILHPTTPTTRYLLDKQMHRSHFQSDATAAKFYQDYFDQPQKQAYAEEKSMNNQDNHSKNDNNLNEKGQPYDSFYQSEEVSSQQSIGHSKSHKKLGLGGYNFRDNGLKKVKSIQGDGKFLVINSKKQKSNHNYLNLTSIQALKEEQRKYEISIQKLREENIKLQEQKRRLQCPKTVLKECQSQLDALQLRIKQLEAEKSIHLTITSHAGSNQKHNHPVQVQEKLPNRHPRPQEVKDFDKKISPTFRNSGEQFQIVGDNSPRQRKESISNFNLLQNIKSPYFLKKN